MAFDPGDAKKVAVVMALGGIAGAAIVQSHHDEKRKSQAEKDDPEGVEWICDLVWDVLDDWEPAEYDREDDYTDDLVEFLRDELSDERGDDGRRISVTIECVGVQNIDFHGPGLRRTMRIDLDPI